MAMQCQY